MLCQVFPENYAQQLQEKTTRLTELLPSVPNFEAFESPKSHFRARAEFRIWHEEDDSFYIMFDQETKQKVKIDACPMAIQPIADLMQPLMAEIKSTPVLRSKLFQIDFLATLSGEMLVTLIYRRPIEGDDAWLSAANALKEKLPITHIIGRARKQKIVLDQDFVTETLNVDGKPFRYQQIENSFTQPNPFMAQSMLHWARKQTQNCGGDLIELYCGNGNFSIALAENFNRVLATEISKTSVASAQVNIADNQIDNLVIVKLAAEEVTEALNGREFFRLKDVDLSSYDFSTIFVDPPRSGLDDLTRQMVTEYDNILYISCNPETLARDLEVICQSHELVSTALFDQFPYSHHIESGVFLKRR
ncbi:tRNA (uridine(54)-C5)-methyltransferase TrmA [Thiomicrorhabdus indica]|uniref:tRNA (uridine(54)-C5)-methyltransferase TrmA n=1 Tax=Thiomicrorhabdus indica TaxID=2267253 RepID=UPI00102D9DC1|nr:tRNA (uridine(54)-C5)-methyltransferase TrmA [Thiomicrorhabdus indica]